ncbi:MAG: twin-arginine translocase subunit TatC, partial [Dehalococcoidia bacterium]|nr:twin-arginine translocase subunit TatC [Dehalococcoidia bacterium]
MASREITLREHFKELRKRLIISVLSILIGSAICFSFWQDIVLLLEQPARFYGVYSEQGLIFTEVTELLSTSFKVSILGGFVLAFPIVAYQILRFVAPGLSTKEKMYVFTMLPFSVLFFGLGVAFAYFILTPSA